MQQILSKFYKYNIQYCFYKVESRYVKIICKYGSSLSVLELIIIGVFKLSS